MSKLITQVNTAINADTFQILVDQVNKSINAVSVECVTTNSHANGGLTTGNGFVEGIFGGRNLVANTIRGGTVATAGVLTITSNLALTGNTLVLGVVSVNTSDISINGVSISSVAGLNKFTYQTTGSASQIFTYFDKFLYRGAELLITTKDNGANAYQVNKLLVVHNSGGADFVEYATTYTNTNIVQFSADANSTHIRISATPVPANTRISGTILFVDI